MNAVEIEAAVADLVSLPFDRDEFAFAFLEAFDRTALTIKRLRKGSTNKSDVAGGVLLRNGIHLAVCDAGQVGTTLAALRESPETGKAKAKFILATDGDTLEAEDLGSGETIAANYAGLAEHFGFFLPLAGISTVREITDNPIDVLATGRLNKLYVEILKHNPEWAGDGRRHDMNHFMARLIFCFFAEDTDIFEGEGLFTRTIDQMTERDGSNLHEVMSTVFRAMDIKRDDRSKADLPNWAIRFPYVNGSLFSGSTEVPRFTKTARSYLVRAGELDWKAINPDIFGSMIQAVANDEERGELGMHYTSVPNILKVLHPLFLDELRQQLTDAGDNARKLLNLRKRMACIRVFDPACGSGNFLVIAYREMRAIEAEINQRRGEKEQRSEIRPTNFLGIELRDFAAEIARLALVIAEYQCDVRYRGQKEALREFLPLSSDNWITCDNALRLEWLNICPPIGTDVRVASDDFFDTAPDQAEVDFATEGWETYICGNPPYLGSRWQDPEQKADLQVALDGRVKNWKSMDYVAGWFKKASDYCSRTPATAAFVSTNSICQGLQASLLWPAIFATGCQIEFGYTSFKWSNLASHNAGVTVVIASISQHPKRPRRLFSVDDNGLVTAMECEHINAYLVAGDDRIVQKASSPLTARGEMTFGNTPIDGGYLLLSRDELPGLGLTSEQHRELIRRIYGSAEFIHGTSRFCIWIEEENLDLALSNASVQERVECVRELRARGGKTAQGLVAQPHRFQRMNRSVDHTIVVPGITSENREYLPCGVLSAEAVVTNKVYAMFDAPLWNLALIASRLHWVWIGAVCVRLEMRFSYSNTLGWNTFPVPTLTEQMKTDLTRCAEDILLAREHYFPATIADMYDPKRMDKDFPDVRRAHERNDEVIERIYIGRRFKNDTERLEKLFDLYTAMTRQGEDHAMTKSGATVQS